MMTDIDGVIIMKTAYSPFGETLVEDNSVTDYKFTGQEYDSGTGLYYYGALLQKTYVFFGLRQQASPVAYGYYDPWLCRFISPDSVLDGLNWYAYCGNNPVRYVDPTGHLCYDATGCHSSLDSDYKAQSVEEAMKEAEDELKDLADKVKRLENMSYDESLNIQQRLDELNLAREELLGAIRSYIGLFGDSFIKSNTLINVVRGKYGKPGKDIWDGELTVDFMGATLFEAKVQTWSDYENGTDFFNDGTLSLGEYNGRLYKDSGSKWENFIKLVSDWLIHPNGFTAQGDDYYDKGGGNTPLSAGCIVMDLKGWDNFTNTVENCGLCFAKAGIDSISVNIVLSSNTKSNPTNIHIAGYQPERYNRIGDKRGAVQKIIFDSIYGNFHF